MELKNIINSGKRFLSTSLLAGALAVSLVGNNTRAQVVDTNRENQKIPLVKKYDGFCYGPFRENENPDKGIYPTRQELKEDIKFLSKFTNKIRTYGNTSSLSKIPSLCEEKKLDCYAGAWLGKHDIENKKEISNLIKIANSDISGVKGLIVGNEVLLRKDLTKKELSDYIQEVNEATDIPVGTAEISSVLLKNKDLAENSDFLLVHIHPYWEGIDIKEAPNRVIETYNKIKKSFPNTRIIIGETGWPSKGKRIGNAVPSEGNQREFFERFTELAQKNNIPYFYFEVFDESWKNKFEGEMGAHWGIFNSDGSLNPLYNNLFQDNVRKGIKRSPRTLKKIPIKAPLIIYQDGGSKNNHFQPTGYMGDLKSITVKRDCKENPHTGETCTKVIFDPKKFNSWASVYWQYPINNWGEYPGYDISEASKLTFWARGEKGGERAEFKIGGINRGIQHNKDKKYQDSFGPLTTKERITKLTEHWEKYEIDLAGKNLESVIGGFCWVTNKQQNRKGSIIYLDDIKIK